MSERLHFWIGYVGSAALVAFLALCLNTPLVATYACDTPPGQSEEQCQLVETLAAHQPAHDGGRPDVSSQVLLGPLD